MEKQSINWDNAVDRSALSANVSQSGQAILDSARSANEDAKKIDAALKEVAAAFSKLSGAIKNLITQETNTNASKLEILLKDFETYEQKRAKIKEEYQEKFKTLESDPTKEEEPDRYASNKAELLKQQEKALSDLDNKMGASAEKWADLFDNFAVMSKAKLREVSKFGQEVIAYVQNTSEEDIAKGINAEEFGMTPEQLLVLKKNADELAKAVGRTNEAHTQLAGNNAFEKLFKESENYRRSIKEVNAAQEKLKAVTSNPKSTTNEKKEAQDALNAAESSSQKIKQALMGSVGAVGGEISKIGKGFSDLGKTLDNQVLSDIGSGLSLIGDTASKIATGDFIGAIFGFVNAWATASATHKKALDELAQQKIEYQRQSNALLHDAAMKESGNIFGSKKITDAKNYYAEAKKQEAALNSEMSKLDEGRVVTGHEKTGLFGWGKGKDVYSSLKDTYTELIDANGKFNASVAKNILETAKLDENTKNMLTDLIQYSTQATEAMDALNGIAEEIVGSMASSMTDAIFNAIETGSDGWSSFKKSGAEAIKSLGKMMVQELIVSSFLEKYKDDMVKMLGNGDTNGMMGLFKQMAEEMPEIYQMASNATKIIFDAGESAGYDMYDKQTRSDGKKGIATASQESVDENNSRLTAIQAYCYSILQALTYKGEMQTSFASSIHGIDSSMFSISENMRSLQQNGIAIVNHLVAIDENTAFCRKLETIDLAITAIKSGIEAINTKGIFLKK